jgi:tetratricopeptide (TPR) repeat protein
MKFQKVLFSAFCSLILTSTAFAFTPEETMLVNESYRLEATKEYPQAISKMTNVYEENKSDYFVNFRMGWLFNLVKKYDKTTEYYEQAAKSAPESLEPWLALSILNFNLGNNDKLLSVTEEILKRAPTNYYGLQRGVTACIKLKKYDLGLTKVSKALDMYPTDTIFLEQKGYILKQMGKGSEAKKVLEFLLLLSPTNAYAKSILAVK